MLDEAPEDAPLRRLLAGLPRPMQRAVAWVRRPGMAWLRLPLSAVLICGGMFGFLPILGFWMVPLGIVLLADDVPPLRRPTMRALAAAQRWWDRRRSRR